MTAPSDDPELRATVRLLADEREIRRVVLRHCRGIDRLDMELVRSCYHPDATDEHGSFEGGADADLIGAPPAAGRVAGRDEVGG